MIWTAFKSINSGENLSIQTDGQLLVIERRHTITKEDTIFLNLGNVKLQRFRFEFTTAGLDQSGLSGFIADNYLHTEIPLNLNGITTVDFSIINVPGSYASNRFNIVLAPSAVLPLSFTSVEAYQRGDNVIVDWKAENESDLKQYDVEKSEDGNYFSKVYTVAAYNKVLNNYSWADANVMPGSNYYRIKSIDKNGEIKYSKVVKVTIQQIKTTPIFCCVSKPCNW